VRFNTMDYRKYVILTSATTTESLVPLSTTSLVFPMNWDADLRSYGYLNEFLSTVAGMGLGFPDWKAMALAALGPTIVQAPNAMSTSNLTTEVQKMLDVALDRDDRFAEIIDQNDADGALAYFTGMLMIDPNRMPASYLLVRVARRIGEHVVMCLKGIFRCPRPSQLCTAIVPMIDPPATPSFPSGHSLQAQLIATCLNAASPVALPLHLLQDLADRIGWNRVIAGLHYPHDHQAGQAIGNWIFNSLLSALPSGSMFKTLLAAATQELSLVDPP